MAMVVRRQSKINYSRGKEGKDDREKREAGSASRGRGRGGPGTAAGRDQTNQTKLSWTSASLLHNTFSGGSLSPTLTSGLISLPVHMYSREASLAHPHFRHRRHCERESSSSKDYLRLALWRDPFAEKCGKAGSRQSLVRILFFFRHIFSARIRWTYATLRSKLIPTRLPILTVASQFSASISLPSFGPYQKLWMLCE